MKNIKSKITKGLAGLALVGGMAFGTTQNAQAQNNGGLLKEILYTAGSLYTQGRALNAKTENEAILMYGASKVIDGMAQRDRLNSTVGQNPNQINVYQTPSNSNQNVEEKPNYDLPNMFSYNSYEPDENEITDKRDFKGLERNVYKAGEELHLASQNKNADDLTTENFYIFNQKGDLLKKVENQYFPGAISPHNISGLEPGKYVFISEIDGDLARTEVSILPEGQMITGEMKSEKNMKNLKEYIDNHYVGVILANDYIDLNNDKRVQAEEIFNPKVNFKPEEKRKAIVFSNGFLGGKWNLSESKNKLKEIKMDRKSKEHYSILDLLDYGSGEYKIEGFGLYGKGKISIYEPFSIK